MAYTLVTGGAKSGKSSFSESLLESNADVCYIATSVMNYKDSEMETRIERHQESRPKNWTTKEQFLGIDELIYENHGNYSGFLLDCVTIWNTNFFYYLMEVELEIPLAEIDKVFEAYSGEERRNIEERIFDEWKKIVNALAETGAPMIMVTNEVGSGVVPMTLLGRWFQDLLGKVNQFLAKEAETVYFVVCGIPQKIK